MSKNNEVVLGSYRNQEEAIKVLKRLKEEGYNKENVTVYTNSKNIDELEDSKDVNANIDNVEQTTNNGEDDRSFWTKVKDSFSTNTYDYETDSKNSDYNQVDDILYPYRNDLDKGNIIVVVENYDGNTNLETNKESTSGTDLAENKVHTPGAGLKENTNTARSADSDLRTNRARKTANNNVGDDNLTENEKIRLKEERLEVDKNERQTGEVNVTKETKHDTKTVDVPVEKEEVVIESKPVAGEDSKTTDTKFDEDSETVRIPVKEEKVEVNKKPVVTEEVEVKKKRREDVESVTEDVKREELDVDVKGNTGIDTPDNNSGQQNKRSRRNKK